MVEKVPFGSGSLMTDPRFVVVYQQETDGDIIVATMTRQEIQRLAKRLDRTDFAIIKGIVVKTFSDNFDFGKLMKEKR